MSRVSRQPEDIQDVLQLISERVQATPLGVTVMVGVPWHEKQLKEGRMLPRWDIDQVSPNYPVVIKRGEHVMMCNSKALEKAGRLYS
ncbi:amidohydrolase family protein [Siminovitchia sediminis]|uniref:Amidohydrolase family protein n=1 Tax=Siminovitchia sediminis TaxID=1274353 RepID=A0ABW4KMB9_9BACI